jgi:glycogen synthase
MALVTFYFQLHQPLRLHPDGNPFLWNDKNEEIFHKLARKCYLPATRMLTGLVAQYPTFKISLSMSGTFLEQAEHYAPEVVKAIKNLYKAGAEHQQVEFLQETYYHSLVGLFDDSRYQEFKEQVSLHRRKMVDLFGVRSTSFRNTELMYNNDIANVVADMGFEVMLSEQRDDMFTPRNGENIESNAVFRAKGRGTRPRQMKVITRNRSLSNDVGFRFPRTELTAAQYANLLGEIEGEAVLLGYDYEHIGEHVKQKKGIDFWQQLPRVLECQAGVVMANPTEVARRIDPSRCPVLDIHPSTTSSWGEVQRDTHGWLGSYTQRKLFIAIKELEPEVRKAGGDLLKNYRCLTTSDHLYYLHEGSGTSHVVHECFSPYESLTATTYILTRAVENLSVTVKNFNIYKRHTKTAVIIITPETARLPSDGMGEFARYVSGKSGGMGEVVSALCRGLTEYEIPVHLIALNLVRRFREEAGLSEDEWNRKRHHIDPKQVHLVTSSLYENHRSAYDGDPAANAAEFQRQIVNTYLKVIRSRYEGRAIVHTNDWMAGGIVSAYAALREIPTLHTVNNTHTGMIPLEFFHGVNMERIWARLYMGESCGQPCVDAQATAIKNATKVSYVGHGFLSEVVEDYFLDRHIIPPSVRQETQVKHAENTTLVIPNGISPDVYPENQPEVPDVDRPGLACSFGPDDNLIKAKRTNLAKFQRCMGLTVDPNAILFFWPSRLDPMQKGIELLEDVACSFVLTYPETQIAVVGDPVGSDNTHAEILGRIAWSSGGRVAYHRFSEPLCTLGYAAASDVFGASLYEPFGQIDVVGNLYGATATNRATGGYSDKIQNLNLKAWGAVMDHGNGVLFKNYDSGALWWGLSKAFDNHRYFRNHPIEWENQMRRIMTEARQNRSLDNMVAGYITVYEGLIGGKHLA